MFTDFPDQDVMAPLAKELCSMREEAIKDRKGKKLDEIWAKSREQFAGIDELNRSRMSPIDGKASTLDGPIRLAHSTMGTVREENRSTVFVNITRPYTNAGVSRVQDILLPTGQMPWDLKLSPVSDMSILREVLGKYPEYLDGLLETLGDSAVPLTQSSEAAKQALEVAKEQIRDWLKECDWLSHIRVQIAEAGKVGTGVLKGPFPKARKVSQDVDAILSSLPISFPPDIAQLLEEELKTKLKFRPAVECIKIENCYPAPGCGEDFQNGKYFYEEIPDFTSRRLKELMDENGYFTDQIEQCLKEGPKDPLGNKKKEKGASYDLWVGHGEIDLTCLCDFMDKDESELNSVFMTWTLCNSRVIKLDTPTLPCKTFPYRMLRWEKRENSWDGIGIPEHIETPQRGLNASVRSLMDNMGYSVGPQVLEIDGLIEPVEGDDTELRPYKRWKVLSALPGSLANEDPTKALTFLEFPNYLNEIMPVIQFWLKIAEDTTGLPLLLQGQAQTDAVGVSQQLMNNSTTNLRQIVKAWDDEVCKPSIDDMYAWCQMFGPEAARGDAEAVALGSSTLLVKELQLQALLQIGDRVLQPEFQISPSKWMAQFLRGNQIDPELLQMDEEEFQRIQEAASQPDPRVTVAEIESQAEVAVAQIRDATDRLKVFVEAQAKGADIIRAKEEAETEAATKIAQEQMKQEGAEKVARLRPAAGGGTSAKPKVPTEKEQQMSTEEVLSTLGL